MTTQAQSILLVEDTPAIVRLLQAVLQDEGYEVSQTSSVGDAIEILRVSSPDLVLSDAFSASAKGALLSVLPLLTAAGETPVAVMTAHRVRAEDVLAQGFCALIEKPFELDTLLDQVRSCLASSECTPA